MLIKSFVIAAAMFTGSLSAAYGAVLNGTSKGVIEYGYDPLGLFGKVGGDLAGLTYSQTISFESSLDTGCIYGPYSCQYSYGYGPSTMTLIVNDVIYKRIMDSGRTVQIVQNDISLDSSGFVDQLYTYTDGADSDGSQFYAYQYVNSYMNAFVGPLLDWENYYSRRVQSGDNACAGFYFYDATSQRETFFGVTPSLVELNSSTSVPEPITTTLFGLGLLIIQVSRHRSIKTGQK